MRLGFGVACLAAAATMALSGCSSSEDSAVATVTVTATATVSTNPEREPVDVEEDTGEPVAEMSSWTYDDLNGDPVTVVYDPTGTTSWATDADGNPTVPGPIDYIDSLGPDCALLSGEYDLWVHESSNSGNSGEGRARMSAYAQYAADRAEDAGC